jgi:hypothetical protein
MLGEFKVLHVNIGKRKTAHWSLFCDGSLADFDILTVVEPYIYEDLDTGEPAFPTERNWQMFIPSVRHEGEVRYAYRAAIWVNKRHAGRQVAVASGDIVAMTISANHWGHLHDAGSVPWEYESILLLARDVLSPRVSPHSRGQHRARGFGDTIAALPHRATVGRESRSPFCFVTCLDSFPEYSPCSETQRIHNSIEMLLERRLCRGEQRSIRNQSSPKCFIPATQVMIAFSLQPTDDVL